MRHILIFSLLVMLSCSKDDTSCSNFNLVTESTEKSARDKCNGLANSYPEWKVITSQPIGCLTSSELIEAKKAESSVIKTACSGITFTIRTVVK